MAAGVDRRLLELNEVGARCCAPRMSQLPSSALGLRPDPRRTARYDCYVDISGTNDVFASCGTLAACNGSPAARWLTLEAYWMARLNMQLFVHYDAFLMLDSASNAFAAQPRPKVSDNDLSSPGPGSRPSSTPCSMAVSISCWLILGSCSGRTLRMCCRQAWISGSSTGRTFGAAPRASASSGRARAGRAARRRGPARRADQRRRSTAMPDVLPH